ncbi:hypothetical protein Hanom_Chr05g00403861 [Helianthus anomalus]
MLQRSCRTLQWIWTGQRCHSHHHLPGRPSFHGTLFQVMPWELQQIHIYEPTLTGLWIWWVG